MIDTSIQGLIFRFLVTLFAVIMGFGLVGFFMSITERFIKDEGWHMFWDMVFIVTTILFALQLAVRV